MPLNKGMEMCPNLFIIITTTETIILIQRVGLNADASLIHIQQKSSSQIQRKSLNAV